MMFCHVGSAAKRMFLADVVEAKVTCSKFGRIPCLVSGHVAAALP